MGQSLKVAMQTNRPAWTGQRLGVLLSWTCQILEGKKSMEQVRTCDWQGYGHLSNTTVLCILRVPGYFYFGCCAARKQAVLELPLWHTHTCMACTPCAPVPERGRPIIFHGSGRVHQHGCVYRPKLCFRPSRKASTPWFHLSLGRFQRCSRDATREKTPGSGGRGRRRVESHLLLSLPAEPSLRAHRLKACLGPFLAIHHLVLLLFPTLTIWCTAMLFEERPWVVFTLIASLLLVWGCRYTLYDGASLMQVIFADQDTDALAADPAAASLFIEHAQEIEFPTPFNATPIQEICARYEPVSFRPGLVFTCEGQHGGIGMLRNQILKCMRHAINAGAALVIPSINLRNPKDLADIETNNEVPLSYLMDPDVFVARLSQGCPKMRIYDRPEAFPHWDRRVDVELVGNQFEPNHPPEGLQHPREWRDRFDDYLAHQQNVTYSYTAPVHVKLEQSFLEYPVHDDGDAFVYEFGKILSFREDTRVLAAKVLWALQHRFRLAIDPNQAITPGQYYGAHLRLEADAVWAWPPDEWRFSRMEDQFQAQLDNLARFPGMRVVYVASGNQTVVDLFRARVNADANLTGPVSVVTKYDLLRGPDREKLKSLTFDQQALVDFLMMFKASAFMGVAHSSFPWNVALRRHEMSTYPSYANEGSDLLRDEYSVIMGMQADYPHVDPFVYGIWP